MPMTGLHQFVRSLDAIVQGGGQRAFATRGEIFAGNGTFDILGECYRLRNATEHMGEIRKHLPKVAPAAQDEHIFLRTRQMEALCRNVYKRMALAPSARNLFRDTNITSFWLQTQRSQWPHSFDITTVA